MLYLLNLNFKYKVIKKLRTLLNGPKFFDLFSSVGAGCSVCCYGLKKNLNVSYHII